VGEGGLAGGLGVDTRGAEDSTISATCSDTEEIGLACGLGDNTREVSVEGLSSGGGVVVPVGSVTSGGVEDPWSRGSTFCGSGADETMSAGWNEGDSGMTGTDARFGGVPTIIRLSGRGGETGVWRTDMSAHVSRMAGCANQNETEAHGRWRINRCFYAVIVFVLCCV